MRWRAVFLLAFCITLAAKLAAGQQQQCATAKNKRSREFVGGTLDQGSALTLTPPPNQAVLPPQFCEYWRVLPEQLSNTTCYPNSPSAGLSYLLVELWLGASWNTTGTSPNWDDVNLSVYRMSNMDDDTWATRKKLGYGYTRYLDKTNGMAYHRAIVSTFQQPGAASRDNTTIKNDFDLDPWYLSIDNEDATRSSNGYTLKVSCVDPNSLPCPSSSAVTPECNSRGICTVNETMIGKSAPVNYCQCAGDFEGFACQTSTADPAAVAQSQAQSQMDSEAAFRLDMSVPTTDKDKKKKKSNFDARYLLALLIIPIAIIALLIWRAVASRNSSQKVADEQAAKPPPPEENKDQMQSIRVDPLIVPAPIVTTVVEEAPKPKWAPAPPVVKKKPEVNLFQYPVLQAADKEPEKDNNSSTTEAPVAVDRARERFYAERSQREKHRGGSSRERDERRSGSKGRKDGGSSRRTHTLRSVDLEEYNRMMKSEDEGLYYRKDKHGRDLLTSFDRESFQEPPRRASKGRSGSRGRDREMSTYDDLDDGYDTYRSGYETGRSSKRGDDEYRYRSGSNRRHASADRRYGSSGRRRPELDTLESDITQSERQSKVTSLSDTEVDSYLDFTPSMVEKTSSRRMPSRGGKQDSEREAPLFREKSSSKFTKKGVSEKEQYTSPARRRGAVDEKLPAKDAVDAELGSLVDEPLKDKQSAKAVSKTRKMRELAEDAALADTVDTLSLSTLDAEPKFSARRSRRETDVDAMLEAALRRDKEKEEKRLGKQKKKSQEKGDLMDDAAIVEDVKSDVVSRASAVSKYSKDSDKLMSKSGRRSSKKVQEIENDGPSSSSGPSFQKVNSRTRQTNHDKIPEHAEDEFGEEIKLVDAVVPEDERMVRKERSVRDRREKPRRVEKEQVVRLTEEELAAQKAAEAAKKEAEEAELRAKQASEERRKRFAAILDQLPDINESSFQRGGSREGGDIPGMHSLHRPDPVPVQESYPVFSPLTPPVAVTPPAPQPTPELQVVTMKELPSSPVTVKQDTPSKKKGWFGFGASSKEATPASLAPVVADKAATAISIHEVQPAVPVTEDATPASPLNTGTSVDLKDGWRAIQQRYNAATPTPAANV